MSRSSPSFEEDLRRIREKRNVSRETLHQRTKIALENIELFEAGDLDRHPHFNDVYLRALVRAYAEVLDISKEMALQALERSRSGAYRGELGDVYLERERASTREVRAADDRADESSAQGEEVVREEDEESAETAGAPPEEPADVVDDGADRAVGVEGPEGSPRTGREDAGETRPRRQARSRRAAGGGLAVWLRREGASKLLMGLLALVLGLLAVWALATLVSSSSSPESVPAEAVTVADTADTEGADDSRPAPLAVIGDSLDVTVIAARDKLEPIRVKLDEGPWNPYWIEQGDSMSFTARGEFALRSYLPRARVLVESLEWPVRATGRYDTLVVSRQQVQERIDSLSAARSGVH